MARNKKTRILLQVDYLTDKVYDVKEYLGDGEGIDFEVEDLNFLNNAERDCLDVYLKNNRLIEQAKNPNEFYNKKQRLNTEISKLEDEERKCFAQYIKTRYCSESKEKLISVSAHIIKAQQDLMDLEKSHLNEIKQVVESRMLKANYKYSCSICLIIRDDNQSLEEWLNWHIGQGVEHFYIYDHNSCVPVSEFIKTLPYDLQNKITVTWFGGDHDFAQHEAYNDCLKRNCGESHWIGFIDSDEMVRVKSAETLPELLKHYEDYAGLFIGWITYNANGQVKKSDLPVRERFPNPSEYNNQCGVGKVFVQPYYMRQMLTHNGYPIEGFHIVDEKFEEVPNGVPWICGCTTDVVCIDHYYTKSYEEWVEKISRGSCDRYYSRKYDEFFKYNPDLEYCREEIAPIQIYEVYNNKNKKLGD